jgi:hypothetical protein
MDVKTAFLYGSLEKTVYMEQAQGFGRGKDMVCKLDRSLYGLKQAPRAWYRTLDSSLKELGFTRTIPDHSIYVRGVRDDLIIVGAYVDDLTIAAARLDSIESFKREMSKRYDMKDLVELHSSLACRSLEIERSARFPCVRHSTSTRSSLASIRKTASQPSTPSERRQSSSHERPMRKGRPRSIPRGRRFAHVRHARNSTGHCLCGRPARTLFQRPLA